MYDREAGASANPWQKVLLVSCLTIVWAETCFILSGDAIRRVGFRGELNNKKRKIGLQKQHEAVGSSSCRGRGVMLGAAMRQTASSVFFGPGPPLVLTRADSHSCSGLRPRGFYWSLAKRAVSSEGPNQTHESCCSFSFTRRTSPSFAFRGETCALVTVSCLSQSTFLLSFRETLIFFFSLLFFPRSSCLCTNLPPGQTANQTLMLNDTEVPWAVIGF